MPRSARFAAVLALCSSVALRAQESDCLVYGVVKDFATAERFMGFSVEAIDRKWGRRVEAATGDSGKYEMVLARNGEWLVTYSVEGYVNKRIQIMLTGIPETEWEGGFGMNVDITMLAEQPGIDYTVLLEPFGIARYNSDSGNIEWDIAYTEGMRERQKLLLEAVRPTAR
ncbi:MAG: hypothetical protein IPM46_09455 [Flavobacteriales bacterium]|nr:hypothetical protein [Flavobacteriales bacterium]